MIQQTKYTLVDKDDNVVGIGTKSYAVQHGLWRRAVHIFLFDHNGRLLICKRPPHGRYPNQWSSSAGGHVEQGESYAQAATRELHEELGISTSLRDVGRFDVSSRGSKMIHHLFVGKYKRTTVNRQEIAGESFVTINQVLSDVKNHPRKYTKPFQQALLLYMNKNK